MIFICDARFSATSKNVHRDFARRATALDHLRSQQVCGCIVLNRRRRRRDALLWGAGCVLFYFQIRHASLYKYEYMRPESAFSELTVVCGFFEFPERDRDAERVCDERKLALYILRCMEIFTDVIGVCLYICLPIFRFVIVLYLCDVILFREENYSHKKIPATYCLAVNIHNISIFFVLLFLYLCILTYIFKR